MERLLEFLRRRWVRRIGIALGVLLVGGLALFAALFFNPLEGDYDGELADLAPSKAILAIHVPDLRHRWETYRDGDALSRYEGSPRLDKFLESELWRSVGGELIKELFASIEEVEAQSGQEILTEQNVLDLLGREFLVFAAPGRQGATGLAIVTRVPFRLKFFEAAFERFGGSAGLELEERTHGVGLPAVGLYVGRVRDCLVLATDPAVFDGVMDRGLEGASDSLRSAGWPPEEDEHPEDPGVYADFPAFARSEFQTWIDEATSGPIGSFLGDVYHDLFHPQATGRITGHLLHPRDDPTLFAIEFDAPQNPAKLDPTWRKFFDIRARPFALERVAPRSAVMFVLRRIDPTEYFERILAEQDEGFRETWAEFLHAIGRSLGRPTFFADDVLANMDGEVAFLVSRVDYSAETEPGQEPPADWFPAVSFLVSLTDPEPVARALGVGMREHHSIWGVEQGSVVQRTHPDGFSYFDWSDNPVKSEARYGTMRPAFAIIGNVMILTTHRAAIRDVYRLQQGSGDVLSADRRYGRALDARGLAGNLIAFIDFQGLLDVAGGVVHWQSDQYASNWQLENGPYLQSLAPGIDDESLRIRAAAVEEERLRFAEEMRRNLDACRFLDFLAVRALVEPRRVVCESRLGIDLGEKKRK